MREHRAAKAVSELRKIVEQMRADIVSAPNANRLKSLNHLRSSEAATLLAPFLDCPDAWPAVLSRLLHQQRGVYSELDSTPRMHVTLYDETPIVMKDGREHFRPIGETWALEHEMPKGKRDRHYVGQAGRWSQLLADAATMIEYETTPIEGGSMPEVAEFSGQVQSSVDALRAAFPELGRDEEIERLIKKIEADKKLAHLKTKHPDRVNAYDLHLKAKKHPKYAKAFAEYERRLSVNPAEK